MMRKKFLESIVLISLLILASKHGIGVRSEPLDIDQPDDPLYPVQWALSKIQALEAWKIEAGDPSVIIAIIDSGINYTLPDLENIGWVNPGEDINQNGVVDEDDFNGIDDDENGYVDDLRGWDFYENDNDPMDDAGHGTGVASVAAATTDNGIGVAGVSQCSVMPLRFMGAGMEINEDQGNFSEAIYYAVENGARVIACVSGYIENDHAINAIFYAHSKGVLFIGDAGTDRSNIDKVFRRPWLNTSHWDIIMLVTGTGIHDELQGSSNWGPSVDISSPKEIIDPLLNGTYVISSGTCPATLIVAGVAGLVFSQNPDWTGDQVMARIKETADPIDHLNPGYEGMLGTGRVNAFRALGGEPTPDTVPPELEGPQDHIHIIGESNDSLTWYARDLNPHWFEVYRNGTDVSPGFVMSDPSGFQETINVWDDSPIVVNISDLVPGVYVFECRVCDLSENLAVDTVSVEVLTRAMFENLPAEFVVSELEVSPESGFNIPFEMGEFVIITVLVENIDEKNGSYIVEWKIDGETIETQNVTLDAGRGRHARAYFEPQSPGSYRVSVGGLTETFIVNAPLEPAEFEFSSLRIFIPGVNPPEVEVGQTVTVTVSIEAENVGELEGDRAVELKVDGEVVDSKEVTLEGGASETVLFELTRDEGTFLVEVEGFTDSFTVNAKPEPEPEQGGIPGFPRISLLIGLLIALIINRRNQS